VTARLQPPLLRFAEQVLLAAHRAQVIVDVGCGSNPDLGLHLRESGYDGSLVFIDWNAAALASHRAAYEALMAERARPALWLCSAIQALELNDSWLVVCRTLPRWTRPGGVQKPRGAEDGARLLTELARTGARGVSGLLSEIEAATLAAGARSLGWELREESALGAERDRVLHSRLDGLRSRRVPVRRSSMAARLSSGGAVC
jgi:hypothetical protein